MISGKMRTTQAQAELIFDLQKQLQLPAPYSAHVMSEYATMYITNALEARETRKKNATTNTRR